ncbi:MAG: T9SS type A sorting domain-containing protein [Balneolales bacterium]|nr:T9SS type A sorting domain-containing protein [Balneolales bacterium]
MPKQLHLFQLSVCLWLLSAIAFPPVTAAAQDLQEAEQLVIYSFTGNSVVPTSVAENIAAGNFLLSAGNITYSDTGTWPGSGLPVAQGAGGWGASNSESAKFFSFIISADTLLNIQPDLLSFDYLRTGAGPQNITITINGVQVGEFIGVQGGQVLSASIPADEVDPSRQIEVRIKGWAGTGGGDFRLNDVALTGTIADAPQINSELSELSGFVYPVGHGPSEPLSVRLEGLFLEPDDAVITIVAPTNFEVLNPATETYVSSFTITAEDGQFGPDDFQLRMVGGLPAAEYTGNFTVSGGGAATLVLPVSGQVLNFQPAPIGGANPVYFQNFSNFVSSATIPEEWQLSDTEYANDFGIASPLGLRGNGVLGYQLSAPTGSATDFRGTLFLINQSDENLTELFITYLGRVARTTDRKPIWEVRVNGELVDALEYRTSIGEDQIKRAAIRGLDVPPGQLIEIEFFTSATTSEGDSGAQRQIGLTNFEASTIRPPGVNQLAAYQQNFSTFTSLETLPDEWTLTSSDNFTYKGSFGSASTAGIYGEGTLGVRMGASFENLQASLILLNNTSSEITELEFAYLGRTLGTGSNSPEWTVFVDDIEFPVLNYSTADQQDKSIQEFITGLSIPADAFFEVRFETVRDLTVSAGHQKTIGFTNLEIGLPGNIIQLTSAGYQQDFSTFVSLKTLPDGWAVSSSAYNGVFGSGGTRGLRGEGVLGYQHTTNTQTPFVAILTLQNNTGAPIQSLLIEQTALVERLNLTRSPSLFVFVNEIRLDALEFRTSEGVNRKISTVKFIDPVPANDFIQIEWRSPRPEGGSGAFRQVGITDVQILPINTDDASQSVVVRDGYEFILGEPIALSRLENQSGGIVRLTLNNGLRIIENGVFVNDGLVETGSLLSRDFNNEHSLDPNSAESLPAAYHSENNGELVISSGANFLNFGDTQTDIVFERLISSPDYSESPGHWVTLASPVSGALAGSAGLLNPIWTQGFPGANDPNVASEPNVLLYNETASGGINDRFIRPAENTVAPGRGFFSFLFELSDGNSGNTPVDFSQPFRIKGEPLTASTSTPFSFDVSYSSASANTATNGWNLLGNPYAAGLNWAEAGGAWSKTGNFSEFAYIWDPQAANYAIISDETDPSELEILSEPIIAPFQAFFVKANSPDPSLSVNANALSEATDNAGLFSEEQRPSIVLKLETGETHTTKAIRFGENYTNSASLYDAWFLTPLAPGFSYLYSVKSGRATRINSLPIEFGEQLSVTLHAGAFENYGFYQGDAVLSLKSIRDIPENWEIRLTDLFTAESFTIDEDFSYTYEMNTSARSTRASYGASEIEASGQQGSLLRGWQQLLAKGSPEMPVLQSGARFRIEFIRNDALSTPPESDGNELPKTVELSQNYPNPFNPVTNIQFALPEASEVRLEIYNIAGQRVATLVESKMEAGYHTTTFDASRLASGVYLYRLRAGGETITRKMTLVK